MSMRPSRGILDHSRFQSDEVESTSYFLAYYYDQIKEDGRYTVYTIFTEKSGIPDLQCEDDINMNLEN
jgi:hypothetical protein